MTEIRYNDVVYDTLCLTNIYVMQYVVHSDPNFLLKAIELQADALRLLEKLLINIEERKPCPN